MDKMIINDKDSMGRIDVGSIPLPDYVEIRSSIYTYSGKVLVVYRTDRDPNSNNYYNIAVANDDGGDFRNLFSGIIEPREKANGIRFMPFQDNTRILLGDYVLECTPDIDRCEKAVLIPVIYPREMCEGPNVMKHWSEIIISPDNEHIAWTSLRTDIGAANAIGLLSREKDNYIIKNTQIISELEYYKSDEANEGFILPQTLRGGELKQFIRGGTAISLAGAKQSVLTSSIVQDLVSEEILQVTNLPCYDETTIFSPDERLGVVMSTRGSARTNFAILGLLPRPMRVRALSGLINPVYMYAVAGVRKYRKGNIGPVLIDIERSMHEEGYQGVLLNDPDEEWVFVSPLSWHPEGKKVLWNEVLRGTEKRRIRRAELLDYQPGDPIPLKKTPDNIPYGIHDLSRLQNLPDVGIEGKIAGEHSGYAEYVRVGEEPLPAFNGSAAVTYVNYSDDGKTFYNGFEKAGYSMTKEHWYEADLEMTGEKQGEIKLRFALSAITKDAPMKLLFEKAADGKPKSFGYAEYNGIRINIEDMMDSE